MSIFMKTVGERVKEERKKRKWSQQDLASRIGAAQAAVSEIEHDIPRSSGLITFKNLQKTYNLYKYSFDNI